MPTTRATAEEPDQTQDREQPQGPEPRTGRQTEGRSAVRSLLRLWPYVRPVRARLSVAAAVSFAPKSAWAQGAPAGKPVGGAGEIVSFAAGKMVVKLKDGSNVTLTVPDNASVSGLQPIPFADLKKGDYIATAATKQADSPASVSG